MAWTPEKEARLQFLTSQQTPDPIATPAPEGMLGFTGKTVANVLPGAAEKLVQSFQGLYNLVTPPGGEVAPTQVPRFFDTQPQGTAQHIIAGAGQLAEYLPAMIGGEAAGAAGLARLGASANVARAGGAALGFALPMAPEGGESMATQGLVGGTMSAAQHMGVRGKIAMGLIGAGAGYYEGQKQSPEMGAVMAGLNFAFPTLIDPALNHIMGTNAAANAAGKASERGPGQPSTIPGFDPSVPVPPPEIAPMQLGGHGPLQPPAEGIPFFQVPAPLDIGGGRPIAGQPASGGISPPAIEGMNARRMGALDLGDIPPPMEGLSPLDVFANVPRSARTVQTFHDPLSMGTVTPEGTYGRELTVPDVFGNVEQRPSIDFLTPGERALKSERKGPGEVPPAPVAPLQVAAAHPQTKLPSGLQKLLARDPAWTEPGKPLGVGYTGDAHALGTAMKTAADVKRAYAAAEKLGQQGIDLLETDFAQGQELIDKAQYLKEAAQFAEGHPDKLAQYLTHDASYKPAVPGKTYLAAEAAKKKVELNDFTDLYDLDEAPTVKVIAAAIKLVGANKLRELAKAHATPAGLFSKELTEATALEYAARDILENHFRANKLGGWEPVASLQVPHADKVRIKGRFGLEEAIVVGREGDTLHVEVSDPIFGKRQTSVLKNETLPVMETPHPAAAAEARPFADVPSTPLTGNEGARGAARTGESEADLRGSMLAGPGPSKGGGAPGVMSVQEALSRLPKEAGEIINQVLHKLQQAAGQELDLHFSQTMRGAKAGAYDQSGRIGFNFQWVSNLVKDWPKMSDVSKTKVMMQLTALAGHEITHVAQRFAEKSGLLFKGKPILASLQEQVEALSQSQREHIITEISKVKGVSISPVSLKYLSGDYDTIFRHYSARRPGLTPAQAKELAAGEFMAEIGAVELVGRMTTTGLPTDLRGMIDKFKEVVVRVIAWLKGNNLPGDVAALQDLKAIASRMYDHFATADKVALDKAFPASAGWRGAPPDAIPLPLLSVPAHGPLPAPLVHPRAPVSPPGPSVPPSVTIEKQFLKGELVRLGVRAIIGGAAGGYLGPKFDPQISTAEGVILGGIAGMFGPAIAKRLMQKDLATEVKAAFKASKGRPIEAMARIFGGGKSLEELGREARFGWTGQASTMAKFVRWFEQEFDLNLDPKFKAILEQGRGMGTKILAIVQDALDKSRYFKPNAGMTEMVEQYFTGKISKAQFEATLTDDAARNYGRFITTAREGMTTLIQMFANGMPGGKFRDHLIASSEKYLGRFYSAYKEGKFNMDAFERAKADYMKVAGVDALRADDHLREHMREVLANRSLFGGRRGNSGQKIDSSLTFRRLATEQEIEGQQVLVAGLEHDPKGAAYIAEKAKLDWMETHKITDNWRDWLGEIKSPVQRMVYSFQKVHASAITAKIYDLLDNSVNRDGLKFAYTGPELTQAREFFEHGKTIAKTPAEVASLQNSIDKLSGYGQLPEGSAYGKLAQKYVDRFTRDEINTYATPYKWMEQPIIRGIAEFNNIVKLERTAFNPLTVIRNYLQMPAFGLIAKTTAGDVGEAYRIIHHLKNEDYHLMLERHIIGADFISSELHKGPGYLFSGYADADIAHKVSKYGIDKILKFYQQPDMLIRAGAFISARKRFAADLLENGVEVTDTAGNKTLTRVASLQDALAHASTIDRAVEFTQRYTMNYATVPRIVKIGRQLPFINLFISYTSEITRILKNLTEDAINPGIDSGGRMHAITTLAAMAAIPTGIVAAFTNSLSPKDQLEWKKVRDLQPDYARARFLVPTRRDSDGRFHYFDVTNLIPADNYSAMIKSFADGDLAAAKTANPIFSLQNTPLLNIAAEQIAGQDLRTGRKMVGAVGRVNEVLKEILPPIIPPGYEGTRLAHAFSENQEGGLGTTNLRTGVQTLPSDIIANYMTGMRFGNVQLATVQRQAVSEAKQAIAEQQRLMRDITGSNFSLARQVEARNVYVEAVRQIMLQLNQRLDLTPRR